jgi:hypothetical protein
LNREELCLFAAEQRARAVSARELANHLSNQEARRGVLRYADELDRNVAQIDAQLATNKTAQNAIDVI